MIKLKSYTTLKESSNRVVKEALDVLNSFGSIDLSMTPETISKYAIGLKQAMNDEIQAITDYDSLISIAPSQEDKDKLREVRKDEEDHLVIITKLMDKEIHKLLPDRGND